MAPSLKERYSRAEYLALEEVAGYKSEYYHGQILAIAGGSLNYSRICGNVHNLLNNQFGDGSGEAFTSDLKLEISQENVFVYPDVMVVCGKIEFVEQRTDTIANPGAIFEVLSKSTQNYDRTDKFELYSQVVSLQEYVLIDQYKVYVEYFQRIDATKWLVQTFRQLEAVVKLVKLGVELPLNQVYRKVEFEA